MRHLPKLSDDYGTLSDDMTAGAVLSADPDELLDAYGDDWSLDGAEELDLPGARAH